MLLDMGSEYHLWLHGPFARGCPSLLRPRSPMQAKGKTSEAITKLCQLTPPVAVLLETDDKGAVVREREVPTNLVHRGDLLKVRAYARV